MPLGYAMERDAASSIARALQQMAEDVERLAQGPADDDAARHPALPEVARHLEAAARILNEGVKDGSVSPQHIADIGRHFESVGRELGAGGAPRH